MIDLIRLVVSVEDYKKSHGKPPSFIAVSNEDYEWYEEKLAALAESVTKEVMETEGLFCDGVPIRRDENIKAGFFLGG